MSGRAPREGGFALLIVLWTLVLLSLLVTTMAATGSGRVRQAADLRRSAQLRAAADGGVDEALFHLLDGTRGHWPPDGSVHRTQTGDISLELRIDSLAGRINPNRASAELLAALAQAVGLDSRHAASLGASIVAWRFPSGQAGIDAHAGGPGYLPPGAPFESIAELGLVSGVTPELLALLAPHLSLYRDGDPDPSAADPVVRQALQLASGLAAPATGQAGGQAAPPDQSLVAVTATAADHAGRRFVRRAVATTGSGTAADTDPHPFRIMEWDTPA